VTEPAVTADVRLIQGAVRFWRAKRRLAVLLLAVFVAAAYLSTGIYTVPTNQTGALFSLGQLARDDVPAGIHFKLPAPLQYVVMANTSEVRRFSLRAATRRSVQMVTGDENLIDVDIAVQYQIANFGRYLTGAEDWDRVISESVAAATSRLMAGLPVEEVLTTGKGEIQIALRSELQTALDRYGAGLTVLSARLQSINPPTEAAASFRKVADAKSEKAKRINEAQGRGNQRLAKARGKAEQIVQQARSVADERTKKSQGDTARYSAILTEYRQARQVTRTDLFLKTMESVLARAQVVLFDPRFSIDLNLFDPRSKK
jgi:modulator of FtsH protease HflK